MPTSAATQEPTAAWQPCNAAGLLALAASPTFMLMAWIAAGGTPAIPLCSMAPGILPINGMTAMYLLMSLFHLSPWLKLISGRAPARS
jgi:hypothetical protein